MDKLNAVVIGGGRIYAGETKAIDDYIYSILPSKNIVILPTASKDRSDYIEAIKKEYDSRGAETSIIFEKDLADLPKILSSQPGLYIGGGDLNYLIQALKEADSLELIREYARSGNVTIGLSAGAALLFEKSIFFENGKASCIDGLGILSGIVVPHFTQDVLEKCRDLILEFGSGKNVYGLSNGSALHFNAQDEYKVITEPSSGGVWKISVNLDSISQEKLN